MAQPDNTDGCMIALYPTKTLAAELALDSGLPPGELHVTIAYAGLAADIDAAELTEAMQAAAATIPPITGSISGHGRFTGGKADVIVALIDSPALEQLRATVVAELTQRGISIPRDHGFTPHMTLAYLEPNDPDPVRRLAARPVTFTALSATHAATTTSAPFADLADLAEAARLAFASGWALSHGPMTPRVQAACEAAVLTALDHWDDPSILEATLQIGKLEGTWAEFFHRREKLTAEQIALVIAILKRIPDGLPVTTMIDRLRAEASGAVYAAEYLRTLTTQAAQGLLAGIYADEGHNGLQRGVEDALRAAMAEGRAGTLALNADKHDVAFSFDQAYKAIADQLVNLPDLPFMARDWISQMIGGAGRDIGNLLARLFAEDATRTEMIDAVKAALDVAQEGSVTYRAVDAFLNQSMATAMSRASLNLYASEGAAQAYFVTAGDGRVCQICQGYEDGNPYTVDTCPTPGGDTHPFCRCVVTVNDPAPFQALAALVP